jgi:hypothetical protein
MLWSLSITLLKWRLPLLDHLEGSVVLHAGDDKHLGVSAVLDKGELGYKICSSPIQAQSRTHFFIIWLREASDGLMGNCM